MCCRCPARPLSLPPTIGLVSSSRLPTSNLQEWSGEPGTLAPAVAFHLTTDLKEWVGEPVTSQVICAPVHCQVYLPAFAIHLHHLHICLQMILYYQVHHHLQKVHLQIFIQSKHERSKLCIWCDVMSICLCTSMCNSCWCCCNMHLQYAPVSWTCGIYPAHAYICIYDACMQMAVWDVGLQWAQMFKNLWPKLSVQNRQGGVAANKHAGKLWCWKLVKPTCCTIPTKLGTVGPKYYFHSQAFNSQRLHSHEVAMVALCFYGWWHYGHFALPLLK